MRVKILMVVAVLCWSAVVRGQVEAKATGKADIEPKVDAETGALIEKALNFLDSKQSPTGSWAARENNHKAAITAYVLHAYLAAGCVPGEGPHGKTVQKGVDFLVECVRPDGFISSGPGDNMYGHGIASLVLGEVYGMATDGASGQRIKPALTRAIKLIQQTQNAQGGWRYQPRQADADISVTVLQTAALRVAKNAGIDVPQATIDAAARYVRSCYVENVGGFSYQTGGGNPGFARTCAAIYALQILGFYNDPMVLKGAVYASNEYGKQMEWFTYGNFYGAPAMYMIGGPRWAEWYDKARGKLVPLAKVQGNMAYWSPLEGNNGVNDVYATAVYATTLAIPYQYLPLYQK